MPTTLATVQDRLPAILERAEATLQTVTEIVSKVPESLDRSNRFFTNVERIFQESELPALSADSRKFFSTTSGQIDKIATDLERVIGTDGTLVTFVENANAAIKAADLPTTNQSARAAADQTTLAADDLRRTLPAIRDSLDQLRDLARQLQEQPESVVYGPRPPVDEEMTRVTGSGLRLLVVLICLAGIACQLKRPETIPGRMIEPQLLAPQAPAPAGPGTSGATAASIRLLDTQARGHIGRRVLHQQPDGELIEDPVWRWSSAPDRYLDTALRLELTSSRVLRLVDVASAPTVAATLLVWHLETGGGTRLVGAVEFQVTRTDHVVQTQVVQASEAVSADLPGDLAAAAGRLLRRLALEGLTRVASER